MSEAEFRLRLFAIGEPPDELVAAIRGLCERSLTRWDVEVVDVNDDPEAAERNRISVVPTLVRVAPEPVVRIVGDLGDTQRVALELGLKPLDEAQQRTF